MTSPARQAATTERVLEAALEVLSAAGFANSTIDAVAARAGVGKATIYRRWPGREALFHAAVARVAGPPPTRDTGSLAGDLVDLLVGVASALETQPVNELLPELLAEAARDQDLQAWMTAFVASRREGALVVFAAARRRGELFEPVSEALVVDMLVGWVFYRTFLRRRAVTEGEIRDAVAIALRGVGDPGQPAGLAPTKGDV